MRASRLVLACVLSAALAVVPAMGEARAASAGGQRAYPLRVGARSYLYTRDGQRVPGDGYRSVTTLIDTSMSENIDPQDQAARMARGGYIAMYVARDTSREDYPDGYHAAYRYLDRTGAPATDAFDYMTPFPFGVLGTNYGVDGDSSYALFDLEGKALLTGKVAIVATTVPDRCLVQEKDGVGIYRYVDRVERIASVPGRLVDAYGTTGAAFWAATDDKLAALYDVSTGAALTDALYDMPSCRSTVDYHISQRNGAYGVLDNAGKEIAAFTYSYIYQVYAPDGMPGVIVEKDGKQGAIDMAGRTLVPLGDYWIGYQEGYWLANQPDGRVEVYDENGAAIRPGTLFDAITFIPTGTSDADATMDARIIGLTLGDATSYYEGGKLIDLPQGTEQIVEPYGYIVRTQVGDAFKYGALGKDGAWIVPQVYDAMYRYFDGRSQSYFYATEYKEDYGYRDSYFDMRGNRYRGVIHYYDRVYDLYTTSYGPYNTLEDADGNVLVKIADYTNLVD